MSGAPETTMASPAASPTRPPEAELFDAVGDCVYALDAEWRFVFFNGAAERYYGLRRDEVLGRTAWEVFPAPLRAALERRLRATMVERRPVRFELAGVVRPDRWVEILAFPAPEGGLCVTFRDRTAQHLAEMALLGRAEALEREVEARTRELREEAARREAAEALRESEARFHAMADSAPALIWMTDPAGRVAFANRRFEVVFGRPARDALGQGWRALLHPEDAAGFLAAFRGAFANRRPLRTETRVLDAAGAARWMRAEAVPRFGAGAAFLGYVGCGIDVTEMREAQAALAQSEARLRLAQEAGGIGTWEWDIATGALHWSESCHRLHGTDPSQPMTLELWSRGIHPDDRPALEAALRATLGGGAPWQPEFRYSRASDGAPRWIAGRGEVVRDPTTGRPLRMLGVALDVTARREAEERQALLMREVDHRAKNALAVVLSLLRLAPRRDAAGFAAGVEGRVAAMARVHTLLSVARWTGADLRAIAEAELAAFLPAAADAARTRLEGPPVRLRAEAAQGLSMLLHELATNAAKHGALSAPEGRVGLAWTRIAPGGAVRLEWREQGGPALSGAPRQRGFGSRLIEESARRQLGGSVVFGWRPDGLRCTVTIAADRCHGEAEPAEDAGRARDAAGGAGPARAGAAEVSLLGRRVLLVEDEALIAAAARQALQRLGCEVVGPAATLREAARLAAVEERLDAAVLDANLRGEPSFPVAALLAARGVPYLFATGYGDDLGGHASGAAAVVRKPYGAEEIEAALRTALAAAQAPEAA